VPERKAMCPVCVGDRGVVRLKAHIGEIIECVQCGHRFLLARPDIEASSADLYSYYAKRMTWPKERVHPPVNEPRLGEILDRIGSATRGRRLLDVGCGAGQWIEFAGRSGWTTEGLDLSPHAVLLARQHGAQARNLDFFSRELDGERFDAITMWELLEHVPNPSAFIQRASELLAPRGVFVASTPNWGSLGRRLQGEGWGAVDVQHVSYLDSSGLRRVAERYFTDVIIETRGLPVPRKRRSSRREVERAVRARVQRPGPLAWLKRRVDQVLATVPVGETLILWAASVAGTPTRG
jgi:2-polyprenyl-3-methyl-5-hydroxy-6-metoxy-1,4-benzoquinol methylase